MVDMTRHLLLLAALAATLTLAACGGGGTGGTSTDREDKAFDGALKFAKCLRDHGIDAPDPERAADGGIQQRFGGGPGKRPDQGRMDAASKACAKYNISGGGDAPDPKKLAEQRDAFVAYARCMRAKGIAMPDPKVTGNGISMMIGKGVRPDSPAFKAADKTCHPLMGAPPEGAAAGPKQSGPEPGAGSDQ
jgi:hypothetical protein